MYINLSLLKNFELQFSNPPCLHFVVTNW